jgi:hypothetical protein
MPKKANESHSPSGETKRKRKTGKGARLWEINEPRGFLDLLRSAGWGICGKKHDANLVMELGMETVEEWMG